MKSNKKDKKDKENKAYKFNKCIYCGKGEVFARVVRNTGKNFLKCETCGFLNREEQIFTNKACEKKDSNGEQQ